MDRTTYMLINQLWQMIRKSNGKVEMPEKGTAEENLLREWIRVYNTYLDEKAGRKSGAVVLRDFTDLVTETDEGRSYKGLLGTDSPGEIFCRYEETAETEFYKKLTWPLVDAVLVTMHDRMKEEE